jgi:hypothetical protein
MKYKTILTLIFCSLIISTNIYAGDTKTIKIKGEVVAPLTISNVTSITGWSLVRPVNGTCTYKLSANTTVENSTGNADCNILTSATQGSYDVSGDKDYNATVSYIASDFSDPSVSLESFEDNKGGNLNNSVTITPDQTLNLTSVIKIGKDASAENHEATVDVTVSYQ